jgi:hypothetical protein
MDFGVESLLFHQYPLTLGGHYEGVHLDLNGATPLCKT